MVRLAVVLKHVILNTACGDSQSAALPCIADPLRGRLLRVPASRRRLASRLSAQRGILALHVAHHRFGGIQT